MQPLVLFIVFGATLLLVLGVFTFLNREALADAEAARARLRQLRGDSREPIRILRDRPFSAVPFLDTLLREQALALRVDNALGRAGMTVSVGTFALASAVCGTVGVLLFSGYGRFAALVGLALGGVGAPWLYVRRAQRKREEAIESQLPDAVDMIVNAMQAGFSLQLAMQFVAQELPAPLGVEFQRYSAEQRLGTDSRTALLNLEARVGTLDMKMLVTSLLLQRDTGGNLSAVLTGVATVIRERVALRDHVRTLTAEPNATAIVLGLLPALVFAAMYVGNREFVTPLLVTTPGHVILAYSVLSVTLGYIILRRMADIEI